MINKGNIYTIVLAQPNEWYKHNSKGISVANGVYTFVGGNLDKKEIQ